MKLKLKESVRKWIWGKSRKYEQDEIATAIADITHMRSNTFDRKLITVLNRLPEYKLRRLKEMVNETLSDRR